MNFKVFSPDNPDFSQNLLVLAIYTLVIIGISGGMMAVVSRVITENTNRNWNFQLIYFLISGGIAGGLGSARAGIGYRASVATRQRRLPVASPPAAPADCL